MSGVPAAGRARVLTREHRCALSSCSADSCLLPRSARQESTIVPPERGVCSGLLLIDAASSELFLGRREKKERAEAGRSSVCREPSATGTATGGGASGVTGAARDTGTVRMLSWFRVAVLGVVRAEFGRENMVAFLLHSLVNSASLTQLTVKFSFRIV